MNFLQYFFSLCSISTVADVFLPEVSTQPRPPASDRGESQLNQSKGGTSLTKTYSVERVIS